jgi:multiple sugar transport system substrate-binding protein
MSHKTMMRSVGLLTAVVFTLSACSPAATALPPTSVPPTQVPVIVEVTRVVQGTNVVEQITVTATPEPVATTEAASAEHPVELHVGVSLNADELRAWLPLFDKIDSDHPEWFLVLDQTPFASVNEKMAANVAAGTLPCVQEVSGLFVNPFILQGAFLPLDERITASGVDMTDFWPRVMEEWMWDGKTYGVPAVAAPEVLYFNKAKFDAAGVAYPTDDWTPEDLATAAVQLTFDKSGKTPNDAGFDPANIKQWGFNSSPSSLSVWGHVYVEPWGGNFCANDTCTQVNMTTPANMEALNFWYDLVANKHAGLYDPYSGAQTGIPGDPLIAEAAAMGYDGYFAIGVIRGSSNFDFGIRQIPKGPKGRSSALSTRGYAVASNCKYPDEAFKLIQELTASDFLRDMWAVPGFSVPARRTAAQVILTAEPKLDGADSVLASMEYAHGFRPNGPGAFEAYNQTFGIATKAFSGEIPLEEGYKQVETTANEILAKAGAQQ